MWKFKPFMPKEPTGLEGRFIDIDKLKVTVKSVIAEGGFSCVYLARDVVNASKQYALKHIICNDEESLDLVKKEISVMKSLKGHPNVVTLYGHSMMDMGRVKEAFLVMEFCEKSLVNVLESRGAAYFEEKQVLTIFRDVCNAVFAMHCQSPPIAHRDLKVENLLLGSDGLWKLCDFGSTSTNHKVFEKPEEMGIEEDNIRKHTTPAYRAPEMWDLFRRDVINEKVDIWALGCLLYRICYFKLAFDGDSKLQVLNGNYRIPDVPKYSSFVTDLIRDMLQSSPDSRPDITQVWFRVNEQLPVPLQKLLPDRPPELRELGAATNEGILKPANRSPMPSRSPPPPPSSSELTRNTPSSHAARNAPGGAGLGAFWSTKHAKDSVVSENTSAPKFDEETTNYDTSKPDRNRLDKHHSPGKASPPKKEERTAPGISQHLDRGNGKSKEMKSDNIGTFGDETFNEFVADFDTSKIRGDKPGKDESLEAEIQRLREQLKRANMEKTEITSKYEKLSAICRSQRQEIQELKQALASKTPCPNKDASKYQPSSVNPSSADAQKGESTLWETSSESKPWQAFADKPSPHTSSRSVRTRNGRRNSQDMSADNGWAFGTDTFNAAPAAASQISRSSGQGGKSQRFGDPDSSGSKSAASQPSGWAAF